MIRFLIFSLILQFSIAHAQQDAAPYFTKKYENIRIVDAQQIKNMATDNPVKSLFYTFGIWCEPCRLHLSNATAFARKHQLPFYVILIEELTKDNPKILRAVDFLRQHDKNINILLLNEKYGHRASRRNKNFLTEITPPRFENIDDMSKYILINTQGEVEMVTSYKDFEGDDWQDDSGIIQRRLLPLLSDTSGE